MRSLSIARDMGGRYFRNGRDLSPDKHYVPFTPYHSIDQRSARSNADRAIAALDACLGPGSDWHISSKAGCGRSRMHSGSPASRPAGFRRI